MVTFEKTSTPGRGDHILVKRIVERHGGQIVAWGKPGAGAKFSFSLD